MDASTLGIILAVYSAVLASVLAVIRILDWTEAHQRIHFAVYPGEIVSGDPALKDKPRPLYTIISIGNRASFPLHIVHIGFTLRGGSALMQMQPPLGSPRLPTKLEPSEGFAWVMVPENIREVLGDRGVDEIAEVYANDGAGRLYGRSLTRREREGLRKSIGPPLTTWQQRLSAWWTRHK